VIVLAVSLLWAFNKLPQAVIRVMSNHGPGAPIYFICITGWNAYVPWREYLSSVFETSGYEYAEAMAFVVVTAAMASILVLAIGLMVFLSFRNVYVTHYLDLHSIVCVESESTPKQALALARQQMLPEERKFIVADLKRSENQMEIAVAVAVTALIVVITHAVSVSVGIQFNEQFQGLIFLPYIALLLAIIYGYMGLQDYNQWRAFWYQYWYYVRDMTAPHDRILDSLETVPKSYFDIDVDLHHRPEMLALRTAERTRFKLSSNPGWMEIEWIHWAVQVENLLKDVDEELRNRFDVLETVCDRLTNMPDSFDEELFPELVRDSLVLDVIPIMESWPEVFEGVSHLRDRYQNPQQSDERMELFEMAVRELNALRTLPIVPKPASVAWLLGFIGFLLAVSPYLVHFLASASP